VTTTEYQASGLTCEHCVNAVTEELKAVPGVTAVAVALVPNGTSTLTITSAAELERSQVADALDEAGDYQLV